MANMASVGVLFFLVAVFSFINPGFLSVKTLTVIANQVPVLCIVAVGMTFILISGGIDLSVGSVMALCGVTLGVANVQWGWGMCPSICLSLLGGAFCGSINGIIVSRWKIPPFITTLAILEIARGIAFLIADSRTVYIGHDISWISTPLVGGISASFFITVLFIVIAQMVLSETVFGRYVIGIGTDKEAMYLSGIDINLIQVLVYTVSGTLAAFAAVINSSRLEAADPNTGYGLELKVIASVVIGGTSILGGKGSVIASCIGVLIIVTLETGLSQVGISDPLKGIITGLVIVTAVILDIHRKQREKEQG